LIFNLKKSHLFSNTIKLGIKQYTDQTWKNSKGRKEGRKEEETDERKRSCQSNGLKKNRSQSSLW
jgi:hypothetical protein